MLEGPLPRRTLGRQAPRGFTLYLVYLFGGLLVGCGDVPSVSSEGRAEWVLTESTLIQPTDSAGDTPFGRVADLEITADGSVAVLDGLNRIVRVFDTEGTEIRSIGRPGQGPGEFAQPEQLLLGPTGNLWVLDIGNGRMSEFDPSGRLVSTYRPADLSIVFPLAVAFSGPETLRWAGISSPDPADPAAAWVESELVDGQIRPVTTVDLPFVEWPLLFQHRSPDVAFVLPVPFSGEPLFGFDPAGRLWYAYTGEPRLHRWSASGGIEPTVELDLDPPAVTAAERDAALAAPDLDEVRTRLGPAGVAELSAMIPDSRPVLAGFFFDDGGRVWVMRAAEDATDAGTRIIDIRDSEGTPIATAQVALASDPKPRARHGLLAGVVRDTLGVESVAVFRVRRDPP